MFWYYQFEREKRVCVYVCTLKEVGDRNRWGGESSKRRRRVAVIIRDLLISVSPARSAMSLPETGEVSGPVLNQHQSQGSCDSEPQPQTFI